MLSSPLDCGCLWRHIFFFLVLAMFQCERQQNPLKCDLRGQILVLVTNYLYHLEQATLYLWFSLFRARMKRLDSQLGHPRPVALGQTCVRRTLGTKICNLQGTSRGVDSSIDLTEFSGTAGWKAKRNE